MIKFSADDIASQSFQRRMRGYDPEQVQEFLTGLAREWEHVVEENRRLLEEVDAQARELKEYRRRERSLVEALETARQVAEEIRHQAERDAELVLAETELKSEKMLARAQKRTETLRGELFELQQQRVRFESEMRSLLQGHLKMLELIGERGDVVAMPPIPAVETPLAVDEDDIEDVSGVESYRPTTMPGISQALAVE